MRWLCESYGTEQGEDNPKQLQRRMNLFLVMLLTFGIPEP